MSVGNCFGSSNPKFVVCLASLLGRLLFVSGLPCLIGFGLGRSKNFFKFSEAIPRERRFHRTKSQATQKSTQLPWVSAMIGSKKDKKKCKKKHLILSVVLIFFLYLLLEIKEISIQP